MAKAAPVAGPLAAPRGGGGERLLYRRVLLESQASTEARPYTSEPQ